MVCKGAGPARDTAAIAVLLRGFARPASHRFELIPIALQRGCVEIADMF